MAQFSPYVTFLKLFTILIRCVYVYVAWCSHYPGYIHLNIFSNLLLLSYNIYNNPIKSNDMSFLGQRKGTHEKNELYQFNTFRDISLTPAPNNTQRKYYYKH